MSSPEIDIPIDVSPNAQAKAVAVAVAPVDSTLPSGFDANSTLMFQAKMKKAPVWFCSFLAGNSREKNRMRDELASMKGAFPLLMKQRNGGKWTPEEKLQLKGMLRSASSVSPYLFIWAVPGSMLMVPFLAWFLDNRRKSRARKLLP